MHIRCMHNKRVYRHPVYLTDLPRLHISREYVRLCQRDFPKHPFSCLTYFFFLSLGEVLLGVVSWCFGKLFQPRPSWSFSYRICQPRRLVPVSLYIPHFLVKSIMTGKIFSRSARRRGCPVRNFREKLKFYHLDETGRLLVVFGLLSFYAMYFHFASFQSSRESFVRTWYNSKVLIF